MIRIKDIEDKEVRETALSHLNNATFGGIGAHTQRGKEEYLSQAFVWDLTPEGFDYWRKFDDEIEEEAHEL